VIAALLFTWLQGADFYFDLHQMPLQNGLPTKRILGACRREKKLPELLVWIVKSRLKQGINSLKIARFGNLAKLKDTFSSLSDSPLGLRMCGQTPDRETSLTRPSMKPSAQNQSALNIFSTSNTSFPTTTKILDLFK